MASIFSKIVAGEIPCFKIAETDEFLAFLDINPVAKGHTLVIPKKEIDYFFDLPDEMYGNLFVFAKKVAKAIEQTVPCVRIGITVLGLEVPHAHVHLVPLDESGVISFKNKVSMGMDDLKSLAEKINENFEK